MNAPAGTPSQADDPALLPAEIIRCKRDGRALSPAQIAAFTRGLVDGGFSEGQAAALAMAIVWRGMDAAECAGLTLAFARSGEVLDWSAAGLDGPVLDKHSTGGVGDKVSLLLAPIVAACGGFVPMVSGRGLGHTGGTLDKLEALPGYTVLPDRSRLLSALRVAGCAIVGAGPELAPADRRLYAIRDVTATVESVPLITASILGKKLAAGLQGLVLDVKWGNGAFMAGADEAEALARNLVSVARAAGLPTEALLSDMNQVLGRSAGNALEVAECLAALREPAAADARLIGLTLELSARLLVIGGLAADLPAARARARRALDGGEPAERFARMVAALGGPAAGALGGPAAGLAAQLPRAPVSAVLRADRSGWLVAMDTRALGLAVIGLGGGRLRPGEPVDARVGLAEVLPLGTPVTSGDRLLEVHAASPSQAEAALGRIRQALLIGDAPPPAAALWRPVAIAPDGAADAPSAPA